MNLEQDMLCKKAVTCISKMTEIR